MDSVSGGTSKPRSKFSGLIPQLLHPSMLVMGITNINKFSSRILPCTEHSMLEALTVQLFFLVILGTLIYAGLKVSLGGLVYLYSAAVAVISISIVLDFYIWFFT